MEKTTITCCCCGTELKEVPVAELSGNLGENMQVELDDLCPGCCEDIWEAIENIKITRKKL
ncbi:MAG: hypothetical protein KAR06_02345 [Deltaproteobacteria bacterium]|nr:hypothetical protein [Deltaproteobacteria bacterium]